MSIDEHAAKIVGESQRAATAKHGEKYADVVLAAFDCSQIAGLVHLIATSEFEKDAMDGAIELVSDLLTSLVEKIANGLSDDQLREAMQDADKLAEMLRAINERPGAAVH